MEDIHTSQLEAFIPKCGHPIHIECLKSNLSTGNYVCPTCKKSVIDMSRTWSVVRERTKQQKMPYATELFQKKTDIIDKVVNTPFGLFHVSN
jgi:4-hydroxy-3-methylbut-2-en-1-yl diphosphate synthase IspG/GcpE